MKKFIIIAAISLLMACSSPQKETHTPLTDSVIYDSVITEAIDASTKPIEAVLSDSKPSVDDRFISAKEAYDEGYYNGYQEGYSDAIHHLEYGYYYNDEPEYSGYLEHYEDGYADGYEDGYKDGMEWNYVND